jgi:hypothetical protein
MAIASYSDLLTELEGWTKRPNLSSKYATWVSLCEADMQVRAKLVDFESSDSAVITAGSGPLPSDFSGMRSVYWDDDTDRKLTYITPDSMNGYSEEAGEPSHYTLTGSTLKVNTTQDGTVGMTYMARFTALDAQNPTNSIITKYPDVYLCGAMVQYALYVEDDAALGKWNQLFDAAITRLQLDNSARRYAGATLAVKAV